MLGNRQIPSVISPVSFAKITYEEAIEDIKEKTGKRLTNLTSIPPMQTSVVLHDPRGGILKATEGLTLQSEVSLCYLITWLQIYTDNYVAKYHAGNDLVVRSVEIRFNNKQSYTKYPNLEGGLTYPIVSGVAIASVNWPCGDSSMERYWEAFRIMMQLGTEGQIKYPIIKVRTVKYQPGDLAGAKILGDGHVFVVGGVDLDVQRYYLHHGQSIPDSLTELDSRLTESENKGAQSKTDPIRNPPQGGNVGGDGDNGVKGPQHGECCRRIA